MPYVVDFSVYKQRYRAQVDSAQYGRRLVRYYSEGALRAAAEIAFKAGGGAGGGTGGGTGGNARGVVAGGSAGAPAGAADAMAAGCADVVAADPQATLCSVLDVLAAGARAVVKARHVLAWSFAFAFFVEEGLHFDLYVLFFFFSSPLLSLLCI